MRTTIIITLLCLVPIITIGLSLYVALLFMRKFACPHCGSRKFKRTPSKRQQGDTSHGSIFEWKGFICKECHHEYTTEPPRLVKAFPIVLGFIVICTGGFFLIDPAWKLTIFGYLALAAGPVLIVYGIIKLRNSK